MTVISSSFDVILATLASLIEKQYHGFAHDPEVDFASMRSLSSTDGAHVSLYNKTGKYIAAEYVRTPIQILLFLDINCNMHVAYQKGSLELLIRNIQSAFDVPVAIKDAYGTDITGGWQEQIVDGSEGGYVSHMDVLCEQAEYELRKGNVVVVIGDFLTDVSVYEDTLCSCLCIQLKLPIVSSFFHRFYLRHIEIPQLPYRFQI